MEEKKIYDFLIKAGMTPEGACGVMGNLSVDSGLNPNYLDSRFQISIGMKGEDYTHQVNTAKYNDFVRDGAKYGIAGWSYWYRKRGLLEYSRSIKQSVGSLDTQLGYLLQELRCNYVGLYSLLCKIENLDGATEAFLIEFVKPESSAQSQFLLRKNIAEGFFRDLVCEKYQADCEIQSSVDNGDRIVKMAEDYPEESDPEPEIEVTVKVNGYTYTGYLQLAD